MMTTPRFAPIALYQEVAELLRQRIFAHELTPGSWLDEQALAKEYGISRTPLREALKVLASEGLVALKPRRGCYVAEISERELDEVFQVLAVLEAESARLATLRIEPAELEELRQIHTELEHAATENSIDHFFDANQRFHHTLQRLAKNTRLQSMIEDLRKVIKLSRHHSLFSEGRLIQSLAEHRLLLEAISRKDTAAVSEHMHAHICGGRAALARITHSREPSA